jgi:hypothetical protein
MQTNQVLVTLPNKAEFDLFGLFIQRSKIVVNNSDSVTFRYECSLDDFQTLLAKTQYRAAIVED